MKYYYTDHINKKMNKTKNPKIKNIRLSMRAKKIDALLITSPENRFYLSGFSAEDSGLAESAGALLITKREKLIFTDGRYSEQACLETEGWRIIEYKKGLPNELATFYRENPLKLIGYEPSYLTCKTFNTIKKCIPDLEFTSFEEKLSTLRSIKDETEIVQIKKAISAAETVLDYVSKKLAPGMSEKEVAWMLLEGIYRESDGPSFPPIVASGPFSALPHAVPGNKIIKPGEPIVIDMGCRVNGYCSDMTRTFFIGEVPDNEIKQIYSIVKKAQSAVQKVIGPGMTCKEADSVARNLIKEEGFGKYFIHSLGHGVGLAVHEVPALSFRNRKKLKPGMVITIEPGIYLPGKGGVRLENMAVIRENGAEILNSMKWYYDF